MGMNFPDLPTNGQVFGLYTYDGEKWVFTSGPGGISQADADARYVNVTGDTMTGNLSLNKAGPTITLESTDTNGPGIIGKKDGVPRWLTQLGVLGTSDYYLTYYNDAGAAVGHAYRANRADGSVDFLSPNGVSVGGRITIADGAGIQWGAGSTALLGNSAANTQTFYANNAGIMNLTANGINVLPGTASTSPTTGALTVAGGVGVGGAVNAGGSVNTDTQYNLLGHTFAVSSGAYHIIYGQSGDNNIQLGAGEKTTYYRNTAHLLQTLTGGATMLDAQAARVNIPITTASTSPTTGALTVAGGVGVGGSLNTTSDIISSASIQAYAANITSGRGGTSGYYYFGNTGTKYLGYDGTNFNLVGGALSTSGGLVANGNLTVNSGAINHTTAAGYTPSAGGYGYWFSYGGATQWGFHFKSNADGSHNAIDFANNAGTSVGSINCTATATAYNTASSAELKEDLKTFDAGNIVDSTDVYDFKWRSTGERAYGVIAQQAIDVYPTAVTHITNPETQDEFWGVDYSKYVPVILQELKALRARVRELEGGLEGKPS